MVAKKKASKKKTGRKTGNGKKVAAKKNTELSTDVIDITAFSGMGNEEVSAEDYALPILRILQKMSPQVDKTEEAYLKGAEAGMFFNTVTNECYDGTLQVVPVLFRKELIEWVPRDNGGGFVKAYPCNDPIADKAVPKEEGSLHMTLPESGNDLVDTYNQYVICVNEDGIQFPALISMTSTQVKKSKQWNSLISQQTIMHNGKLIMPPRWAFMYDLKTVGEKNDYGSFYNFSITVSKDEEGKPYRTDQLDTGLFKAGHALYTALKSGDAKANYEADSKTDNGGQTDDIPF